MAPPGLSSWFGSALMDTGGAAALVSTPLAGTRHIRSGCLVSLPEASFILMELYMPPACFTCTGHFAEFERAAAGIARLGNETGAGGAAAPLLHAVSVDCAGEQALCSRLLRSHLEPYGSFMYAEPPLGLQPSAGWLRAWPTSGVLLGKRSDLLESCADLPTYWYLPSYASAEDLIDWVRAKLRGLPQGDPAIEGQAPLLGRLAARPRQDFDVWVARRRGAAGVGTARGCVCRPSWRRCSGGFLGHWQACERVRGCDAERRSCPTIARCWGSDVDACSPESFVVLPSDLRGPRPADVQLAVALGFRLIWASASFGAARREVLLRFLALLCAFFPDDGEDDAELLLRQATAALSEFRPANASARRLWPWSGARAAAQDACRSSLCRLRDLLTQEWRNLTVAQGDAVRIDVDRLERRWRLCGRPWYAWTMERWAHCSAALAGTRQLPCGVWSLVHTVLARAAIAWEDHAARSEQRSAGAVVAAVRGFLLELLPCPICVRHLLRVPFDAAELGSYREAVLWLWGAHSAISRIVEEGPWGERAFGLDPLQGGKAPWPTVSLCPGCLREPPAPAPAAPALPPSFDAAPPSAERFGMLGEPAWDRGAVYRFLVAYYGGGAPPDLDLRGESKVGAAPALPASPPYLPPSAPWAAAASAAGLAGLAGVAALRPRGARVAYRRLPEADCDAS